MTSNDIVVSDLAPNRTPFLSHNNLFNELNKTGNINLG